MLRRQTRAQRPIPELHLPELHQIAAWFRRNLDPPSNEYRLTRVVFLRGLGLVYSVAFLGLAQQLAPLFGERGLLPAHLYLAHVETVFGEGWPSFSQVPTLLWLDVGDSFMSILAWAGFCLALTLLAGSASGLQLLALWVLYTSFVNIGQLFYGYGWEMLLLESGFLAVFLCPSFLPGAGKGAQSPPPPKAVIWLLKWTLFRVVFGAGLIKLRGDPCWRDLTCLIYHYETQPIPNPLSWYIHQLPPVIHKMGVLFNHLVEIVAPWFLFGPRRLRLVGGVLLVVFQLLLIASGNLSWLNYMTLTLCVPCFDDRAWRWVWARISRPSRGGEPAAPACPSATRARPLSNRVVVSALVALVLYLSVGPVANMLSSGQVMNTSFDRLNLVNTYGAFGSVGKVRREGIIQGTTDVVIGDRTQWREYEFKCKPGDPGRRPCVLSPYHLRVDWQIWFAAMSDYRHQPWLVHLVYKLLLADPGSLSLLGQNPFPGERPTFVRAELYEYEFTGFDDSSGDWWKRRRIGQYLPAVSAHNPALLNVLRSFGWPLEDRSGDDGSGEGESSQTADPRSATMRQSATADGRPDLDVCRLCGHS